MLDVLLARGADLAALTPDNQSHADLATVWQDGQLASKKLGREAYRRSEPELAASVAKIDVCWAKPGEPVTEVTKTNFVNTCMNGDVQQIAYMLHLYPQAVNWHIDRKDQKKCNGLIAGISSGPHRRDITRLLIAKGADVNQRNGINRTALHYAALVDEECVTMLMQAGADETLYDSQDRTPYDLAQARANSNDVFLRAMDAAIIARNIANGNVAAKNRVAQRSSALLSQLRRDGHKFKMPRR